MPQARDLRRAVTVALLTMLVVMPAPLARAACSGPGYLATLARSHPDALAGIVAKSAAVPYARGRFWRVEKDGRVSHIFGTLHSADPALSSLPAPVEQALEAARLLLVEVLPEEQRRLSRLIAADPDRFFDAGGAPLSRKLSAAAWRRLRKRLTALGYDPGRAARIRPWFAAMLIASPPCILADMRRGARLMDFRLVDRVRESGRPVRALEGLEETLAIFELSTEDRQLALLRLGLAFADRLDELTVATRQLYLAGEIHRIWLLNETFVALETGEAALMDALQLFRERALVARNRAWLPAIEAELARGGVFIAVGALHLSGPDGLPALLSARGYRISPVTLPRPETAQ